MLALQGHPHSPSPEQHGHCVLCSQLRVHLGQLSQYPNRAPHSQVHTRAPESKPCKTEDRRVLPLCLPPKALDGRGSPAWLACY